jgi:SAM-dependent methyltransferase
MPLTLPAASSLLTLFADPTRVRLVSLLAQEELSVAELTRATGLSQSRVSTHLGKLREAGLLRDRRAGASTFYRAHDAWPEEAARVWGLLSERLDDGVLATDLQRAQDQVAARGPGDGWVESVAGHMEHHYSPGRTWEATARGFVGLLELGDVLDAGSGDGALAELVAPRARTITCLDRSEKALAAARLRLRRFPRARFAHGDLLELPFDDGSFDHVLCFNVLTYARDPKRALTEMARVLRPGGRLAGVTLGTHGHREITRRYGHIVDGFAVDALVGLLAASGLVVDRCEVTSRERRPPHFEVLTFFADLPLDGARPPQHVPRDHR